MTFHPSPALTLLTLRRIKILLILRRSIHNLLYQSIKCVLVRRRLPLQPRHLILLLNLRALDDIQPVERRAGDFLGEFLILGPDVDAALLDVEDFGLCGVEVRGVELGLECLDAGGVLLEEGLGGKGGGGEVYP